METCAHCGRESATISGGEVFCAACLAAYEQLDARFRNFGEGNPKQAKRYAYLESIEIYQIRSDDRALEEYRAPMFDIDTRIRLTFLRQAVVDMYCSDFFIPSALGIPRLRARTDWAQTERTPGNYWNGILADFMRANPSQLDVAEYGDDDDEAAAA